MAYIRVPTSHTAADISFILQPRQPPATSSDIDFTAQRLARYAPERIQVVIGSAAHEGGAEAHGGVGSSDDDSDDGAAPASPAKISKPPGEPGRPDSGGWSLKDQLVRVEKWGEKDYKAIRQRISDIAKERNIDLAVNFANQKAGDINAICDKMREEYTFLEKYMYEDCWPVKCIMKSITKYRSEHGKKGQPPPQA
ncbi:hypothetical protein HGRIS_000696 [Hohenbuehelia grisea]|uniref:Uncharacterized protein n=1 Tax=Hohenbuehelia grisea TaxID=104357 RepID=A0ABR3JTU2_9AGAR